MAQHQPEIFSIAVPTDGHLAVCQEIISYQPKAIICEKPIAVSSVDGRLMQSLADDHQCVLAVNYMRRFDPGAIALKRVIRDEELGMIFKAVVWYSKGILNNGSHFIDILHYWLGDVTDIEIMRRGRKWEGVDPEPDFCLHFGGTLVYFLAGLEEYYSMGEIDLFATGGVIRYIQGGSRIEIVRTQSHPIYPEYTILNSEPEIITTDMKRYQWQVLDSFYKHLNNGMELNSDAGSAIKTLEVVESVLLHLDRRYDE
jgi:predicted dehydrogenase